VKRSEVILTIIMAVLTSALVSMIIVIIACPCVMRPDETGHTITMPSPMLQVGYFWEICLPHSVDPSLPVLYYFTSKSGEPPINLMKYPHKHVQVTGALLPIPDVINCTALETM
jgi:hypothetical protein